MTRIEWPSGRKSVAVVSVNFDAEALDLTVTSEGRLYGRYGYGRYGANAGLPRLLRLLDNHAVKATFFICGEDAARHRAAVETIVGNGHEVACRGMTMEELPALGQAEASSLRQATEMLEKICGERPQGFRAPGNALSARTLEYLTDLDYTYDSSFQDDDYPYVIAPTSSSRIVEIPTSYALEDAAAFSARHTHKRLFTTWRDECAAMQREGTLIPLTVHLRGDVGVTRPARISALDELLWFVRESGETVFMTALEIARHTAQLGLEAEEDPLAPHAATLREVPFRGDLAASNSAYKR